jgi:hypothetical protein
VVIKQHRALLGFVECLPRMEVACGESKALDAI